MKIIKFEPKYRDDLIFMILEAKNALGRVPGLHDDLLDVQKNYFEKGDMFWIALNDNESSTCSKGQLSGQRSSGPCGSLANVESHFIPGVSRPDHSCPELLGFGEVCCAVI